MKAKRIHVAAAIEGDGGRILLRKRAEHLHQGGLWEFPGGKLEPGEGPLQGLASEMREELGIVPVQTQPLIRISHAYPDRQVLLRSHELPDRAYRLLAEEVFAVCRSFDARLLLSRPGDFFAWVGMADGIHLTRHQLMALECRPAAKGWIGGSCHNPEELSQAIRLGLDYAFLSPVEKTTSHPRHSHWVGGALLPG